MAAGTEGVGGRSRVQVQASFTAQPQGHVRAHLPTHGALPLTGAGWRCPPGASWTLVLAVAPVVVAVDMTAVDVDPGLLLVHDLALRQAGKGQRVEANWTLGPGGI